MLDCTIENSWKSFFDTETQKDYFKKIEQEVHFEYENHICFPPKTLIFNAFQQCDWSDLKVVVLGQDPYHGTGEAHGLAFSVKEGIAIPPSLKNIYIEI